jgi:heme exporter protein C
MVWAKFTWGAWWTNDPKLNGTAITILIYLAYFVLRNSIDDERKRARVAAVYNIFAFVMMIVFIGILPRMTDSLHPGNGGNPGFNSYDLDNRLRAVFYPAVLGWILVGTWIASLRYRLRVLQS